MTLIATLITKFGIVQASDSNITSSKSNHATAGQKIFLIEYLKGSLSIAGSYSVSGERMDKWMAKFIESQRQTPNFTLAMFANKLKNELESKMSSKEKKRGSMIHIAGYASNSEFSYPEFWFIRNIHGINKETGMYEDFQDSFLISEDYWNRDSESGDSFLALQSDSKEYQIYFNGFPPGRIAFNYLRGILSNVFREIWNNKKWNFRPPKNLLETEKFLRIQLEMISLLFEISDYQKKVIGGEIQILGIPQPNNIFHK